MSVHSSSGDQPDRDPILSQPAGPEQASPPSGDELASLPHHNEPAPATDDPSARADEPSPAEPSDGTRAVDDAQTVDLGAPASDSEAPASTQDRETAATPAHAANAADDASSTGPGAGNNQDNAWADAAAAAASELPAPPPGPPLPESFDELALPDTLRRAIAKLGWTKPSPVQALSFEPLIGGRDVMVQSHTGSGKTGAFCVPWLASRFDPQPASETGVQLLVLLPTRELAKQVCDELRRLAVESPVDVLPVYGGTPMNPQLTALRAGVHAVVGTPGRILDHIRRRSLDLSKVRTVVLDECDEMLSMGFLEDIRAILDQVKGEHLTALFSATIPSDIERIAKRYMKDPASIQLSGDQVAAAEIEHAFYSVTSSIKTRDLLDVIMVEDPARAIVFCNTREETKLVASVLRREGFHAEELSSDLNQTQRERVMKLMREHKLRFLVATDVAARGIDISHVSHVINYSFPESAEVYVHRTGRTGRAGRTGVAISLINPREIGNFYYLKLQYSSIVFSERHLPPAEQLAAERTEFKLDGISKRFPELVSPEWVLLARSLMGDPRGERVIALLLERAMRAAPRPESIIDPSEREALETPEGETAEAYGLQSAAPALGPGETIEREQRDLREGREREVREPRFGDRDRGRGPRDRDRGGPRDRDRPRRDEPRFGDRPRRDEEPRAEGSAPPEGERNFRGDRNARGDRPEGERNFRGDRGDRPEGERNFRGDRGDRPEGERNFRGDRPAGDRPEGERNFRGDRPEGERNFRGDRPAGDRPEGARNFRGDRPAGDRPEGERNFRGDRPAGDRPEGERNFRGDRPAGDRPEGERHSRDRFRDRGPRRDDADRGPRPESAPQAAGAPREDRGERRRRRDRGNDSAQLPLQATGEASPVVPWIDPPTPVLSAGPSEPAPAPAAVLATVAVPGAVATLTSIPAPGQLRLDRRGRLGDRGRFALGTPVADTIAAPPAVDTTVATAVTGEAVTTDPGEAGESGEGRRKRRRRRRRGRRGEGEAATDAGATADGAEGAESDEDDDAPEAAVTPDADLSAGTAGEADDAEGDDSEGPAGEADTGPGGEARRKRRRRRRGGARVAEAPRAPEPPPAPVGTPVPVARRIAQDEIIIDIDESELEVVQSEFGDLDDEFDEFALMDRRQAVIETLQEEVELEDVSRSDARRVLADEDEADSDADSDADEAPADAESTEPEASEAEPSEATESGDAEDPRKARRRRRRKKAAPVVMPELTAPPHKDFWEVWANKFTYQDFEDGKYTPPNNIPEIEDEPPAPVPADRPAPRAPRPVSGRGNGPRTSPPRGAGGPPVRSAPPPVRPVVAAAAAEADDGEFTKVCLNLGRSHGHKAATIRGLLRDHLGLEGRAIRDLTVRDADTLFRVHADEVPRISEALTQVREGQVQLAIQPASDDAEDVLRAPPPDALPEAEAPREANAASAEASTDVASEPAEPKHTEPHAPTFTPDIPAEPATRDAPIELAAAEPEAPSPGHMEAVEAAAVADDPGTT